MSKTLLVSAAVILLTVFAAGFATGRLTAVEAKDPRLMTAEEMRHLGVIRSQDGQKGLGRPTNCMPAAGGILAISEIGAWSRDERGPYQEITFGLYDNLQSEPKETMAVRYHLSGTTEVELWGDRIQILRIVSGVAPSRADPKHLWPAYDIVLLRWLNAPS